MIGATATAKVGIVVGDSTCMNINVAPNAASQMYTKQWWRNRNMIEGAGMRGCEAADYPHEASACEGQELGGLKPP